MAKKASKETAKTTVGKHVRPTWDEYFMNVADLVGSRGTCDRGRSGCVIVKDKRILVTGYVGSPAGLPHCDDVGHELHKATDDEGIVSEHCVRTIHAEQNAISQAAQVGISIYGSTLYCHMTPCYTCAKLLINCGVKRVVADLDYHRGERTKKILKEAGVIFELINTKMESYTNDRTFHTRKRHEVKD